MLRKSQYKDLEKWKVTASKQRKRYYGKTSNQKNSRKKWTQFEIEAVLEHSQSDFELSKKIGRSVRSIQIKRCRLNKEKKK